MNAHKMVLDLIEEINRDSAQRTLNRIEEVIHMNSKKDIEKAMGAVNFLRSLITDAHHSAATENNQLLEMLLFDVIGNVAEIENRIKQIKNALQ